MTKAKNKANPPARHYAVKDAARNLVLTIEQHDVDIAKRRKNNSCAVAQALCRQEHYVEARVYKNVTYCKKRDGSWLRFITPGDLYMELMIFDRGGRMDIEQSFKLEAPTGSKRMGHHAKPTGRKRAMGKLPTTPHIVANVREHAPKGKNHLAALFE